MTQKLSKLERVDLGDVWEDEAKSFTPWLAREENLALLSETIGIELKYEAQEKNVGPFRADILCKNMDHDESDESDESWVLIENQLKRTDHIHLGQLLTYASGLDAVTIIWIAAKFTEEHRAALDWLNKITDEEFRFFGLEVEAWRIDDSPPAPKFNIISQPNNWSKFVSGGARKMNQGEVGETKALQLRYWQGLEKHLQDKESKLRTQNPRPRTWQRLTIGVSNVVIEAIINLNKNTIRVELNISHPEHAEVFFNMLEKEKEIIENEIGHSLEWRELPEKKSSKISIYKDANAAHEVDWPVQHAWFKETMESFDRVFTHRIKDFEKTLKR